MHSNGAHKDILGENLRLFSYLHNYLKHKEDQNGFWVKKRIQLLICIQTHVGGKVKPEFLNKIFAANSGFVSDPDLKLAQAPLSNTVFFDTYNIFTIFWLMQYIVIFFTIFYRWKLDLKAPKFHSWSTYDKNFAIFFSKMPF